MNPTVSIIVPVLGDGPELDQCVQSILDQSYPLAEVEIIIVDNGSTPAVVDRWAGPVRLALETVPGSYAARAHGVASAVGDVLAFTDADCRADADWIARGVAALRSANELTMVAGRVELETTPQPTAAERYEARYGFQQDAYLREGFGVTANLFVTRAAYDTAGGFDVALRSGGDWEFGQRATRAGVGLVWCPDAVVRHPARSTLAQLVRKVRRTTGGVVQLELRAASRHRVATRALWTLRPPIREARAILYGPGPLRARLGVLSVLVLLRGVAAFERLRVVWSGRTVR